LAALKAGLLDDLQAETKADHWVARSAARRGDWRAAPKVALTDARWDEKKAGSLAV